MLFKFVLTFSCSFVLYIVSMLVIVSLFFLLHVVTDFATGLFLMDGGSCVSSDMFVSGKFILFLFVFV